MYIIRVLKATQDHDPDIVMPNYKTSLQYLGIPHLRRTFREYFRRPSHIYRISTCQYTPGRDFTPLPGHQDEQLPSPSLLRGPAAAFLPQDWHPAKTDTIYSHNCTLLTRKYSGNKTIRDMTHSPKRTPIAIRNSSTHIFGWIYRHSCVIMTWSIVLGHRSTKGNGVVYRLQPPTLNLHKKSIVTEIWSQPKKKAFHTVNPEDSWTL